MSVMYIIVAGIARGHPIPWLTWFPLSRESNFSSSISYASWWGGRYLTPKKKQGSAKPRKRSSCCWITADFPIRTSS